MDFRLWGLDHCSGSKFLHVLGTELPVIGPRCRESGSTKGLHARFEEKPDHTQQQNSKGPLVGVFEGTRFGADFRDTFWRSPFGGPTSIPSLRLTVLPGACLRAVSTLGRLTDFPNGNQTEGRRKKIEFRNTGPMARSETTKGWVIRHHSCQFAWVGTCLGTNVAS